MKQKTVREIAGEIWSEIFNDLRSDTANKKFIKEDIGQQTIDGIVDLIMGVLARHEDTVLINDKDLPVKPLPNKKTI